MGRVVAVWFMLMWITVVAGNNQLGDWIDFPTLTKASNLPGVELTISQQGLNYAANVALDQLSNQIKGQSIPDQHGDSHVVVGKVSYDVTRMQITSFNKPSQSVAVHSGKGITWSMTNAGVSLRGDWHYEYKTGIFGIKVKDSGSFDVSVSGAWINAGISMGKSSDGHPTIRSTSCSAGVGDVNLHIHGGASWLYDIFKGNIEHIISDKLRDMLCQLAKNGIDVDAEKALERMKVQVPVDHSPLIIDYRLVTSPVFGNGYIKSNHKGEFFLAADRNEAPFSPQPMKTPLSTKKMVTFCMADYVVDTLGYILNKYKLLMYTMTQKDLPEKQRGFLQTTCNPGSTCIGNAVKELGKKFPNCTVEIFMQTTSAPTLNTLPNDITGRFNGTVIFYVRKQNGDRVLGFSAHTVANVSLTGKVALNDSNRVTAQVKDIKFHMTVTKSNVGPIHELNMVFYFAIHQFVIPKMNEIGRQGFELPSVDVIQFVDPEINILQGTICFGTNAKYVPPRGIERIPSDW